VLADGRLASGGQDGMIKLWPTGAAGEPVVLSQGGGDAVTALAVLKDGRLATSGQDGKIRLWPNVRTDDPVVFSHASGGRVPVTSLAVLSDGRLASGDDEGTISLWSEDTARKPVAVLQHGSEVGRLVALKDGRLASSGEDNADDKDGTIKVWSKEGTGDPVAVLRHGSPVSSLVALKDGRLASGGGDGKIKLWAKDVKGFIENPEKCLTLGSRVTSLAVLADGRLAGGGENGTIKLWPTEALNSAAAQERGCAAGETLVLSPGSSNNDFEAVQSLAVLADGWLASGGEDGLVKLWSTKFTGEPVVLSGLGSPGHELKGHGLGSGVSSLAVLPDGRLVSAGFDGALKLWLVNEQELIAALCLRAGRNLTKGEWARYVGRETPWQPSCRSFGVPSNWRTIDEHKGGAPALDNAPAEAGSAALPAPSAGIVNLSRGGALSR